LQKRGLNEEAAAIRDALRRVDLPDVRSDEA